MLFATLRDPPDMEYSTLAYFVIGGAIFSFTETVCSELLQNWLKFWRIGTQGNSISGKKWQSDYLANVYPVELCERLCEDLYSLPFFSENARILELNELFRPISTEQYL